MAKVIYVEARKGLLTEVGYWMTLVGLFGIFALAMLAWIGWVADDTMLWPVTGIFIVVGQLLTWRTVDWR